MAKRHKKPTPQEIIASIPKETEEFKRIKELISELRAMGPPGFF